MTTELLPCPFCGGGNVYICGDDNFVSCQDCSAYGPSGAEAWNTRPQPIVTTDGLVELIRERKNQDFDGECHLTCAEADQIADRIASLERALTRPVEIIDERIAELEKADAWLSASAAIAVLRQIRPKLVALSTTHPLNAADEEQADA